jgi:signal transduction histidine kinase
MIRHRLLAAILAGVAAVLTVTGIMVVSVLEGRLVATVDQQLVEFANQQPLHVPGLFDEDAHDPPGGAFDVRHMALVGLGPDGEARFQIPSGPTSAPDALPDVSGVSGPFGPRTLPSVDDGPDYRTVGAALPDGGVLVAAIPLTDVEAAVAQARQILLAAGTGALAIVAAIVWLSIRRGLRPIDHMIAAAERIAAGELTARTTVPNPSSEVGHLASALNTMLDRIQGAMAARAESEARMRRFVADASHELRTPLTSIRGYAELHRQGATSSEEVARGMARIEDEARRMGGLVDDLLLLARLDQASPLATDPVDLTCLVGEAVGDGRAIDPQRTIVLELPDRPVIVRGDRARLRQVLDNLLANLRDHTDPGTTATISLAANDGAATVTVADDGPGMSPDEAARAFDRFWQAEATTTHPRPGAGLGLAIVTELIAAHDGTIALDTSPDGGTALSITLPLPPTSEPGRAA